MALSLREFPWYAQVGVFVAVSSLAVGGFYYWYAEPMRVEIESRQATLNQLRAEIEKGEATARRLPEFQAEVSALQERLDDLRAVLPEQKDVGDLLRRLQTLATQSNLTILGFKPQPIATQELHAEWPIIFLNSSARVISGGTLILGNHSRPVLLRFQYQTSSQFG